MKTKRSFHFFSIVFLASSLAPLQAGLLKTVGAALFSLLACRGEIESGMKSIGQEGGAFVSQSVAFTENNQVAVVGYGRFPGSSSYHWIASIFDDDLTYKEYKLWSLER
ncbi:MAG: hypothetical protein AAF335_03740 [Bacteroidota bacterium]